MHPRTQHCFLLSAAGCATGPLTGIGKSTDSGIHQTPVGHGSSGVDDGSVDNDCCTTAGAKGRIEVDDCDSQRRIQDFWKGGSNNYIHKRG